jgi:hypothetical protein
VIPMAEQRPDRCEDGNGCYGWAKRDRQQDICGWLGGTGGCAAFPLPPGLLGATLCVALCETILIANENLSDAIVKRKNVAPKNSVARERATALPPTRFSWLGLGDLKLQSKFLAIFPSFRINPAIFASSSFTSLHSIVAISELLSRQDGRRRRYPGQEVLHGHG